MKRTSAIASWRSASIALLAIALAACGGGVPMLQTGQAPIVRDDESMVVFMRPSPLGEMAAASVFDITGRDSDFIGILQFGTKVAHTVKPGTYTFMVVGETADFMQATLLPGRTYYALVTPRTGFLKPRFSFRPVRQQELSGAEFARWYATTKFVENTDRTRQWAAQNMRSINGKRAQHYREWPRKPEEERVALTLNADDGWPPAGATVAVPVVPVAPVAAASAPVTRERPATRMPQKGDRWTYRLREPRHVDGPRERKYVVTVARADELAILDRYSLDGATHAEWLHEGGAYLVPLGVSAFSPYLQVFRPLAAGRIGVQIKDPGCSGQYLCTAQAVVVGQEVVRVPAGEFDAEKIVIEQSWGPAQAGGHPAQAGSFMGARRLTVWYAPAVKRAVKYSSRPTVAGIPPIDTDFDLELESYQVK